MESIIISNNDNKYDEYYLQFNDNIKMPLSNFTILVKSSLLLQSFFDDEDVYSGSNIIDRNIPMLCPSAYVLDENNECYFNNKKDLLFMFTYPYNKFLDMCNFLDIICYKNKDKEFSTQFILYVMNSMCTIPNTKYFMQYEIKSIINYYNNIDIDIQIRTCTPEFYFLYLTEYKEEVVKYNRYDIYTLSPNKYGYYQFLHKYNNALTNQINQELMRGIGLNMAHCYSPNTINVMIYNAKQNKYIEPFDLGKYIYCLRNNIPYEQITFGNIFI